MKCPACWVSIVAVGLFIGAVLLPKVFIKPAALPAVFQTDGLSLARANEIAQGEGKPVLAFVTAEWCGSCQKLKRTALGDERVQGMVKKLFVPVTIEETSKQGKADLAGLPVRAFPTLLVIRDGQVVSKMEGAQSTGALLRFLEEGK